MISIFDKALKYSYAAQKQERHKLLRVLFILLSLYLLYNVINTFFCSVWVLQNDTMQPGLRSGDRLIAVSSAVPSLLTAVKLTDETILYKRGNIVLIDTNRGESRNWLRLVADNVVRFFTAQQITLFKTDEHLYVKRLIALPGDEISMANFVLRVKPAGTYYSLTEFELSERPYYPSIPQLPAQWDATLPFSGNMDSMVLGSGEYFVVADDRGNTGDSRTWGPISAREIIGKPVFRFWPLSRIGRP
ncbi:MAG: signal peptidase I [Treponema sp.]|jgi:signal peptidase I|nr:signal peptidase I [Treponema sp.]